MHTDAASVYLVSGKEKIEAFRSAIERSSFPEFLEREFLASGRRHDDFAIAIKADFMNASRSEREPTNYTDPILVEELVNILRGAGFSRVSVVESQSMHHAFYRGRSVAAVAAMCGYTGKNYRIVDLGDKEEAVDYDYGGILGTHPVGRAWLDADYRISFGKNRTHWQFFYSACLGNLYGCLPHPDKLRVYHGGTIKPFEAIALLAEKIPVHFGFLDAWTSGDSMAGYMRDARPRATRTIMASPSLQALDWVVGEKMRVDPALNALMQEGLIRWNTMRIIREGNMNEWEPWKNISPLAVSLWSVAEQWPWLATSLARIWASPIDKRFRPSRPTHWLYRAAHPVARIFDRLATRRLAPSPLTRRIS